ncbi:SpoIIE family protein phosphatase [Spirulina sp. CS-785/01]|uniref:SpoIIE family protein phosphatase n=1 Tax=Spirulina sp. CS-785/01 TaxID=3021716 RepID=UPI00232BA820|nr:SpoIIE family protein phosphatase [Spirulina sp. CS-785/01]MDB9313556.1 SpoIIE family protein phosphatase [Spirulina sp. CS-785/01]
MKRSLTHQITLRVLLLSLIGVLGIGSAILLRFQSTLQQIEKRLSEAAVDATVTFDLFFLNLESELVAISTSLSTSNNTDQVLRQVLSRNLSIVDLIIVTQEGEIIAQQHRSSREKVEQMTLPSWFNKSPQWGEVVYSPVQFDQQSPYLEMAVNVTDEIGLSKGILLARIDLTELWDTTIALQVGDTGYVYLTDESGKIVASRNRRLLESKPNTLADQPPERVLNQALQFKQGLRDQRVFLVGRPLQVVPWYAVVEQSAKEAIAPFLLPTLLSLLILLCVLILIYTSIQFNRRRIISPLVQLHHAVTDIATGDLHQTVRIQTGDEFGELAQAFNQMTDQLTHSFATLAQKNEELQRLDQLKDQFLANTSHELRTPLNGMIGLAESLLDGGTGELNPKQRDNLLMIAQSGHRLANLVNDILDFSKLKQEKLELQLKPINLASLGEVVLTLGQTLAQSKNLDLINDISPDLPPVLADENRLQQILYNLVGNAIKFTDYGHVTLSAKLDSPSQMSITVADTGIGIPNDKLKQVFESFEQADGSTARQYGGTGLGLAVSKDLIELHQGTITVESTVGEGSQFTFTLPISPEDPDSAINLPSLTSFSSPFSPNINQNQTSISLIPETEVKVLIVDDEPINLQVLLNNLTPENYNITQASNGEEVLKIIEQGYTPDVILLDVMMPKMTGYEVTEILRETYSPTELPILLLTAKTQVQDIVAGFNVGANDYLTKPIAKDELLARLKTHLKLRYLYQENVRLAAELEITRKLQEMIIPGEEELEQIKELQIAGFMQPAEEVGGDFYDIIKQNGSLKFCIGDATGHGLESGLLMIMMQTALRTLHESKIDDPVQLFDILNRTIYGNLQRIKSHKTMSLAILSYRDGELQLSGQHEEVIIVRNDGQLERFDTLDLGFPIGLDENIAEFFSQLRIPLNDGDVVVLYTDGITEAENDEQVHYGLERLCTVVQENYQQSPQAIRDCIIADVNEHRGRQVLLDDLTLVVFKK